MSKMKIKKIAAVVVAVFLASPLIAASWSAPMIRLSRAVGRTVSAFLRGRTSRILALGGAVELRKQVLRTESLWTCCT